MQLECHFTWEGSPGSQGLPLCSQWHQMHPHEQHLSQHIVSSGSRAYRPPLNSSLYSLVGEVDMEGLNVSLQLW